MTYPSRAEAVRDFLLPSRAALEDVYSKDDPVPARMEFIDEARVLGSRLARGLKRSKT